MFVFSFNSNKYIGYQNIIYTLFLLSGAIKPFFIYIGFPIDITLMALLLVVFDLLFNLIFRYHKLKIDREQLLICSLLGLFFALVCLSLIYTASPFYSYRKVADLIMCLLVFVYPVFMVKINLKYFYWTIILTALPISFFAIIGKYIYLSSLNVNYTILSPAFMGVSHGYLDLGTAIAFLGLLSLKFSKKKTAMFLLSTLIILGLGSRGPLIFLLLTVMFFYYKKRHKIILKKRALTFLFFLFTAGLLVFIKFYEKFQIMFSYGYSRFVSLFNPSNDLSVLGRLDMYEFALDKIQTFQGFTIGYGVGSFGMLFVGEDIRAQAHNILLDIWFELGIVGVFIFSFFLVIPFFLKRDVLLKTLAFYIMLSAMKSSSYGDDRIFFGAFALLIFTKDFIYDKKV